MRKFYFNVDEMLETKNIKEEGINYLNAENETLKSSTHKDLLDDDSLEIKHFWIRTR